MPCPWASTCAAGDGGSYKVSSFPLEHSPNLKTLATVFSRGQRTDSVTAFILIIISIITEVLAWGHPSWSGHGSIDLPLATHQVTANFPYLLDPYFIQGNFVKLFFTHSGVAP